MQHSFDKISQPSLTLLISVDQLVYSSENVSNTEEKKNVPSFGFFKFNICYDDILKIKNIIIC